MLKNLAQIILSLLSWKLDMNFPSEQKYILVGAPHTSNWDLFYTLLMVHAAGIKLHWIGKDSLFRGPLGPVMRRLGGIPVNRRSRNDFVSQMVKTLDENERMIIAIAPEGTRSKADYWKSGFYYIALGAKVPIALGFIDFAQKTLGIGPNFIPSGDLQADFPLIQAFYANITGKHPGRQGSIRLNPDQGG